MEPSNKPRIKRIFFCRGSRVGCDSPLTSVKEHGSDEALRSHLSTVNSQRSRAAFTLIELLVVMAIIAILLLLVAPAFTNLKSAGDVTSAAYTIKGVLDTARTYAKANNTYTWVGFYEENVSNPTSPNVTAPAIGRVVMSIVASKDGTNVGTTNPIDPTTLIQVGKLTKIDNAHLATNLPVGSGAGTTFDTRPPVPSTYCLGDTANSTTPFQYPVGSPAPAAQYTFVKAVQFSPGGEARVNNNTNSLQTAAEIGLRATHGTTVDVNSPNVAAIQFGGVGGDVIIYRK
jgi:prepilin-type N-terminal cleavage/methylation domain-containing protein